MSIPENDLQTNLGRRFQELCEAYESALRYAARRFGISTSDNLKANQLDDLMQNAGVLPVKYGGTGQSTVAGLRNAIGLGNTTGALPVINGGTGATDAATARANIQAAGITHTHSAKDIGTGTLSVQRGGTNLSSIPAGKVIVGNGTSTPSMRGILDNTSKGSLKGDTWSGDNSLVTVNSIGYWNGAYAGEASNITHVGTITSGKWAADPIPVIKGGTGAATAEAAREALGVGGLNWDTLFEGTLNAAGYVEVPAKTLALNYKHYAIVLPANATATFEITTASTNYPFNLGFGFGSKNYANSNGVVEATYNKQLSEVRNGTPTAKMAKGTYFVDMIEAEEPFKMRLAWSDHISDHEKHILTLDSDGVVQDPILIGFGLKYRFDYGHYLNQVSGTDRITSASGTIRLLGLK